MASPPPPPTYSRQQLAQYLDRTNAGPKKEEDLLKGVEQAVQDDPLGTLAALQRRHLTTFLFSNISMHYSRDHSVSLDPEVIFHRVIERGLGGYCMENTSLFQIVLRALGYRVFAVGGRVSKALSGSAETGYGGLSHMALIVTIGERKYLADVGFGPWNPIKPLLLEDGTTATGISPAEMRLRIDNIPANIDSNQRLWIYESRINLESPWIPAYCFSEMECGRPDFEIMNFFTSKSPNIWFTSKLICTKMMLNQSGDEIIGQIIMAGDEVKRRVKGNTEERETLKTESDRVAALEKWFGVRLQEEEIQGIRGLVTELASA